MKKALISMIAAAVMMLTSITSYADIIYKTGDSSLEITNAAESTKNTIIIKKDNESGTLTDEDIVYIDEADAGFSGTLTFLLKSNPPEGKYQIIFGGDDGTTSTKNFYIGMNKDAKDEIMTKSLAKEDEQSNSVRYLCSVSGEREFKTVIMKMNNKNYAFTLNQPWSISATQGSVMFGVEIVADSAEEASQIQEVWLSERSYVTGGDLQSKKEGTN